MRKRYLLITNPRAGRNRGEAVAGAAEAGLLELGVHVECALTDGPASATRIAKERGAEFDVVLAVGGDGTLNEVLAGIVAHPQTALGVIPVGTANVVAREMGLPLKNPKEVVRLLHEGKTLDVYHPTANGRPFFANLSVGFDAEVIRRLEIARRKRPGKSFGMLRYIPVGLRTFFAWRADPIELEADGHLIEGGPFGIVTLCRTRNYGGILELTPDAALNHESIEVCARRGRNHWSVLRHLAYGLLRWKDGQPEARYFSAHKVRLSGPTTNSIQIDGESAGSLPVTVEVAKTAVALLVPAAYAD